MCIHDNDDKFVRTELSQSSRLTLILSVLIFLLSELLLQQLPARTVTPAQQGQRSLLADHR